ncbi:hypothetical protein VTJ04DRAFT_4636 [Mycothermus thermophilus]|uniref:uncharacterized protein n=1 Tax=Humicola insolens TaxID=85995 RepID=UPI0037421765
MRRGSAVNPKPRAASRPTGASSGASGVQTKDTFRRIDSAAIPSPTTATTAGTIAPGHFPVDVDTRSPFSTIALVCSLDNPNPTIRSFSSRMTLRPRMRALLPPRHIPSRAASSCF